MAARNVTATAVLAVIVSACAAAGADAQRDGARPEKIYLLHADARELALVFGSMSDSGRDGRRTRRTRRTQPQRYPFGEPQPLPADARPDDSRPPRLVAYARVAQPGERPSTAEQFAAPGGAAVPELLPGEMRPPIPIPGENALLVLGTPAEIDAFREIVKLLDVPSPQVRIRVDMVNALARTERGLGLDLALMSGPVDAAATGNAPPDATIELRLGLAKAAAVLGAMERRTRGTETVGAEVMTTNYVPAVIAAGQTVPFFVPQTVVTAGAATTDYIPYTAFVGVELWVLPRVNADDTVSMMIRPSLVDELGVVQGPGDAAVPITKQTYANVVIRVPDGETVCIGGLPRRQYSTSTTPLGTRQISDDSELLVFVTPMIVPQIGMER